jgi:hypothetical protein
MTLGFVSRDSLDQPLHCLQRQIRLLDFGGSPLGIFYFYLKNTAGTSLEFATLVSEELGDQIHTSRRLWNQK